MSVQRTLRLQRPLRRLSPKTPNTYDRRLRIESLEDRRLLAVMLVTDLGDGPLASLAGDGKLSLREAVEAVNTDAPVDGIGSSSGPFGLNDVIIFSSEIFGGTPKSIALTAGQLELTGGVSVVGPIGNLLTIDAQQNSRIFNISENAGIFPLTVAAMTLTGGQTTVQDQAGGAIRSLTSGLIILTEVVVTANATTGNASNGGAISTMGSLVIKDSSITNNHTEKSGGGGGAVFALGDVELTRSTLADNRTEGAFANGGGLSANGFVTLNSSTVSGNRTSQLGSSGGGILAFGGLTMTESTVSGNQTAGNTASGGGISSSGTVTILRSTIVDNQTLGANATGGGIETLTTNIVVSGSIIANNSAGGGKHDINPGTGTLTVDHSLIGDATGLSLPTATNLLNQDPRLGALSGGGKTKTHAPLPGSPVIDAGDALIVSPPAFDQRGVLFSRIANGDGLGSAVIDLGSHEVQAFARADFDGDNDVDGADFLAWQRGFGKTVAAQSADGNADDDQDVDGHDRSVWELQFGDPIIVASAAAIQQLSAPVAEERAELIDLAIAVELDNAVEPESDLERLTQPTEVAERSSREQAFAAIAFPAPAQAVSVDLLADARASQISTDTGLVEELLVAAF